MSSLKNARLDRLLELANYYPSPHNGQPIQLRVVDDENLIVWFDTSRGLKAAPISHLFSLVSVGVFARHFELCATSLGHSATFHPGLPQPDDMARPEPLKCGLITIEYGTRDPNPKLESDITTRQTSRRKYVRGLSPGQVQEIKLAASRNKLALEMVNHEAARHVIWLNQRAVFDDMFDTGVRTELDHWLRYSRREKEEKRDGLAYDCMQLSGSLMKFSVDHYRVLHWPVVAPVLRQYYLRTMADSSAVGYLRAPFETSAQAYRIGRCIIDIWFELTARGAYLHPFGTVVSNARAHRDFTRLVGADAESRGDYVVFIFRAGYSEPPVRSLRLPVKSHLLAENQAS